MLDTPGGYVSKDINILTITKNKAMIPLPVLMRQALKYIYDQKSMTRDDISNMMNSITNWFDWIKREKDKLAEKLGYKAVFEDMRPVGTKGTVLDEKEFWLVIIGDLLHKNDMGKFEEQKAMFKKHGIDYRKYYGLAEAYKPEDFIKAQAAYEKAKLANPGDYN